MSCMEASRGCRSGQSNGFVSSRSFIPKSAPGTLELMGGRPRLENNLVDVPDRNTEHMATLRSGTPAGTFFASGQPQRRPHPPWPPRHVGYVDLNVVCFRFDFPGQVVFNLTGFCQVTLNLTGNCQVTFNLTGNFNLFSS